MADKGVSVSKPDLVNYVGLTYGAVIKNDTNLVARDVEVTFTVKREDGQALTSFDYQADLEPDSKDISYIGPGEKFGIGGEQKVLEEGYHKMA